MFRVPIESRAGNIVLGVLGVVYFFASGATLIYYVISNWGANSLVDRALQGALLVTAAVSVLFVLIAAGNLALKRAGAPPQTSPKAPEHRTAAEAGS